MKDLKDLREKRYWKVADKEDVGAAYYDPQSFRKVDASGNDILNSAGLTTMSRDQHGNIVRRGRRQFGLNYKRGTQAPAEQWQAHAWHEGDHYLQDVENIHPDTVRYIRDALNQSAATKPDFGAGFPVLDGKTAEETLKYFMEDGEILSRIQEARRGMMSAGVQRPDLPGHAGDLTETLRFLEDKPDWYSARPIENLQRLFSNEQLARMIRSLPMVGAVAGPAAAAAYIGGEA
jgi:hypothetical protein